MHWSHLLACFFAGMFLANAVPHFVHGVSGNRFPTPFAKPPGRGLSSPIVNVAWGWLNLLIGYLLFHAGKLASTDRLAVAAFFAGVIAISLMLSVNFAKKEAS